MQHFFIKVKVGIKINARRLCVDSLTRIIKNNEFSNRVIDDNINKLKDIDKNFYRQLVLGVVENLYYIDYVIEKFSNIKLNKIDTKILNIIRIGVYELRFLDSKNYAVINEAVNNTKKINYRAKNMVNAILRNIERTDDSFDIVQNDKLKELSIRYSTNLDIVKYLKKYYKNYEEIISSFSKKPLFCIRVNDMKVYTEDLVKELEKKGYIVQYSKLSKNALFIENPQGIFDIEEFKLGYFTVQDEASILVSEVLNPKAEAKVLDLCAAPGSKSTHLLQIMKDVGIIYSNDISLNKLSKIEENFNRLNLKNYIITNYDASNNIDEFYQKFDYILVDAPCSGIGVIKRKPEIKLNRNITDIKALSEIQFSILDKAYSYLKKGGYLVYSTCTLGRLENQDIIKKFNDKYPDIENVKINGNDYIEILPTNCNDGFFICKMKKN